MISLLATILLVPLCAPNSNYVAQSGYQNVARVSCVYENDTFTPINDFFGEFYKIHNIINFECTLSFNDVDNYYLSNFNFRIRGTPSYYRNSQLVESGSLLDVTYSPSWSFNNSNFDDDYLLDTLPYSFIDDDSEMNVGIRYAGVVMDSAAEYLEERGGCPSSEYQFSFYTDDFIPTIENYIKARLYQGVQENADYYYQQGYQTGYAEGFTQGSTQDETAVAIFSGMVNVGLIPVNFFLSIFNFEVFGINISAMVSAFLTIAIIVIIVRMVTGKKND